MGLTGTKSVDLEGSKGRAGEQALECTDKGKKGTWNLASLLPPLSPCLGG